ncbi:MAG TPA: ABC transporter permease [Acidimicrobiales bacterium]
MLRATLKNLAAHKLRLALTGLAVVLGVSFMAGTFVLTDTIKRTFDNLFTQTSAGKDVIVRGATAFTGGRGPEGAFGGNRPLVPASVLATVRSTPGVQFADGSVQGQATLLATNGKAIVKHGPPTLAFAWLPDRQLSSFTLRSGRGPSAPDELTVDSGTVKDQHFHLGQRLTVVSNQPPRQFTLVGVTGFGAADNVAGATLLAFTPGTAQELVGKTGYFSEIDVARRSDSTVDALQSTIAGRLPANMEAVTATSVAQQAASAVATAANLFNKVLLSFALIALFVGAFLIFNTFSILVGQRTRELALLRAVGASRGQVNRSVLTEALVVGLGGSLVGVGLSLPLSAGLYGLLRSVGFGLPSSGLRLLPRTVVVSMLTGTAITMFSAILPARRASRVPPVAAMREDVLEPETSLRRRALIGGAVLAVGLVLLFGGLFLGFGIALVGAGCAVTFVGVAMLTPFISAPLARLIGAPLVRAGALPSRLARENSARNPRRTAGTASALMIGLAVVTAVATIGSSARASFSAQFDRSIRADYVVTSSREGFPGAVEPVVRHAPGVTAFSPVRNASWHDGKAGKDLTGISPTDGPGLVALHMVTGSAAALGAGRLLVDDKVARSRHLSLGQTVEMTFGATGTVPIIIGGTYASNQFLGNYLASDDFVAANVNQVQDVAILVDTSAASPAEEQKLNDAIAPYGNVKAQTGAQFKNQQKGQLDTALLAVYLLLALSILIALIGVVNTLALSVMERTREIGLLRGIGMQRRQTKRMIRGEAVVVSLIGAVLGLALGVGLGAAVVRAIGTGTISTIVVPVSTIVVVVVLTGIFGVVASWLPARRAARLDVLQAIATT